MIKKVKENVTHQGIGGEEIYIYWKTNLYYLFNEEDITIALSNFFERRMDLMNIGLYTEEEHKDIINGKITVKELRDKYNNILKNFKVYYGHVGALGYYVAEDEVEDIC